MTQSCCHLSFKANGIYELWIYSFSLFRQMFMCYSQHVKSWNEKSVFVTAFTPVTSSVY